jgi:hypothetical protein
LEREAFVRAKIVIVQVKALNKGRILIEMMVLVGLVISHKLVTTKDLIMVDLSKDKILTVMVILVTPHKLVTL